MPQDLAAEDVFTTPVVACADGDDGEDGMLNLGVQCLANRTEYLKNRVTLLAQPPLCMVKVHGSVDDANFSLLFGLNYGSFTKDETNKLLSLPRAGLVEVTGRLQLATENALNPASVSVGLRKNAVEVAEFSGLRWGSDVEVNTYAYLPPTVVEIVNPLTDTLSVYAQGPHAIFGDGTGVFGLRSQLLIKYLHLNL